MTTPDNFSRELLDVMKERGLRSRESRPCRLGVLTPTPLKGRPLMAAYVPIDLHRHRSVVMQMAADGEVLGWVRLANDPETLVAEVLKAGEAPEVAIEATYGWYWAVDALQDAGVNVHLVAPSVRSTGDGSRTISVTVSCSAICCERTCSPKPGSPRRSCVSGVSSSVTGPSSSGSARG